jgi:hypothetical protein
MSNFYKPTENNGLREDGMPDHRVGTGEFAYGKVDPSDPKPMNENEVYKPTEHAGLREDGMPDQRVGTGEFAHGKVDASAAGRLGGLAASGQLDTQTDDSHNSNRGADIYKPTEHGGLREDGMPDARVGSGETYKPTEHSGLRRDGEIDQRVNGGLH